MKKLYTKDIPSIVRYWIKTTSDGLFSRNYYRPHNLPESINVMWEYDKENKSYYAEVTDLPGLYTTSRSAENIIRNINSLIYKHFDTPNHIAIKDMERGLRYNPPLEQIEKIKSEGGPVRTNLVQLAYSR